MTTLGLALGKFIFIKRIQNGLLMYVSHFRSIYAIV